MKGGATKPFRNAFTFANKEIAYYFPGHMARGMKQMQQKLKNIDAIIEVHDARIPFSGRNPNFDTTINLRPHMLILNKMDLTDMSQSDKVIEKLKTQGVNKVLYTNCQKQFHLSIKKHFLPAVLDILGSEARYHRSHTDNYNLLVIGVPNVGKSSFINALRRTHLKKGRATRVGGVPGITRSVAEKIRVLEKPEIYVYDSPGILSPNVDSIEVGMKLAACSTLKDHLVGEDLIADYVLFWLNKNQQFRYVQYFNLPEPTDDIFEVLAFIAKSKNFSQKTTSSTGSGVQYQIRPNFVRAAQWFIGAFRNGLLGKFNLDVDQMCEVKK